ncbi:unnamed protein product [Microthlaspi erraticum]|uniref:Uncharacterized protein n=1 Tax=Microthlaspi erraticum TaxID=1685480 RepID=A0A6D2ISF4_9BRAS|nr:unnamed protein product [Microthlaspi erraticum]
MSNGLDRVDTGRTAAVSLLWRVKRVEPLLAAVSRCSTLTCTAWSWRLCGPWELKSERTSLDSSIGERIFELLMIIGLRSSFAFKV